MDNTKIHVDNLIDKCNDLARDDITKALDCASQALSLATNIQYDLGVFESHFCIARLKMTSAENEEAIQHLDVCYSIAQALDNNFLAARTTNSYGTAYYNLGVTSKSLEYLLESLDICKVNKYDDIECRVYNNISTILTELGDYQTSLEYLYALLDRCYCLDDTIFPKYIVYRNLAHTLFHVKDVIKAEDYAIQALEEALSKGNNQIVCECYYILGEIRTTQKRYSEAETYFIKALDIAEETSNDYYIVQIRSNLGKLYCVMNSYDRAYETTLYAYNYSMKLDYQLLKRNVALTLADICRLNGNTKMLVEALTAYKDITSLLEEDNLKRQKAFSRAQLMLFNLQKDNERLRVEIERDPLTGCLSGRTFPDRITKALSISGNKGALIFLDVDNLKTVNDTYGHDAGDDLLRGFATDLAQCLPKEAIKIRLCGDEFLVFLPKAGKAEATEALDKLLETLSKPHRIGSELIPVAVSAGIALYPEHSTDIRSLKKMADSAMYSAKQSGRGGYHIWSQDSY